MIQGLVQISGLPLRNFLDCGKLYGKNCITSALNSGSFTRFLMPLVLCSQNFFPGKATSVLKLSWIKLVFTKSMLVAFVLFVSFCYSKKMLLSWVDNIYEWLVVQCKVTLWWNIMLACIPFFPTLKIVAAHQQLNHLEIVSSLLINHLGAIHNPNRKQLQRCFYVKRCC